MAKKRASGLLSHFSVRVTLTYTPLIAAAVLLAIVFQRTAVDSTIALPVLGAEAQVFATFALLAPMFFAFSQFYRRGKPLLRELTITAVTVIMMSVAGIILSIVTMVFQLFALIIILFLLLIVAQDAFLMSLFLLTWAGFKPAQNWIGK